MIGYAEGVVGRGKKIDDVTVVIEAATAMIDERGIEEFSTRRLAAVLRISAMTLYNYFADRRAILKSVAIRCLEGFNLSIEREIESSTEVGADGNPMRLFKIIARRLLALSVERPRLYLFLFESSVDGIRDDPEVLAEYHRFVEKVAAAIPDPDRAAELRGDVLLFEMLANSHAIASVRWPRTISDKQCLVYIDRAYDRILACYERDVVGAAVVARSA